MQKRMAILHCLPAMEHGLFAMRLGAGRAVKSDDLDYETELFLLRKLGILFKKATLLQLFIQI